LQGSDLREADLSGADLTESGCIQVDFGGAKLDGLRAPRAMFLSARLADTRLRDADLGGALLHAAAIENVRFERCAMRECSLEKACLREVAFADCDLRDTRFDHADLDAVAFARGDLARSRFHGTAAVRTSFRGTGRRGMRGSNQALLDVEAPTLSLEDLPCPP
jgi:uncharacterized protein YjbI with pentapeptide repeats